MESRRVKQQLWLSSVVPCHWQTVGSTVSMSLACRWLHRLFVVNATGLLKTGKDNEVLVRLDNRDNPLIPPETAGTADFCYYGGLYRNVNLIIKPSIHITTHFLLEKPCWSGIFCYLSKGLRDKGGYSDSDRCVKYRKYFKKCYGSKQSLYEWKKNKGNNELYFPESGQCFIWRQTVSNGNM